MTSALMQEDIADHGVDVGEKLVRKVGRDLVVLASVEMQVARGVLTANPDDRDGQLVVRREAP